MPSRHDYTRQAQTYDSTRSASPSVLAPLRQALAGAPGRRLLDVGGGTGNYARALAAEGWEPVVADVSEAMLARAGDKGLETVRADATDLPFPDTSFDAVTIVSMIHHVSDQATALAEARRVLKPRGALAFMGFTREHIDEVSRLWDAFPATRDWMEEIHPPLSFYLEHLPGAELIPVIYTDLEDASLHALLAFPETLRDPEMRRQTSFFERAGPNVGDGVQWLLSHRDEWEAARRRHGDAVVIAWRKP